MGEDSYAGDNQLAATQELCEIAKAEQKGSLHEAGGPLVARKRFSAMMPAVWPDQTPAESPFKDSSTVAASPFR
jgi:hypothetical protein